MKLTLESFILLAILIESVVQTFKFLYDPEKRFYGVVDGKLKIDVERLVGIIPNILGLGIGILVAFVAKADLFAISEIPLDAPEVGYILTGIILSRGSSLAHDLYKSLRAKPAEFIPGVFPGGE